ncbi:MAG: hypothetical protein CVT95_11720, partial [Bacteroidetes bacterium HGW-Bacteroidetes-12]
YKVIIDTFASEYISKMNLPNNHPNMVDAQMLCIEQINKFRAKKPDDFLLLAADALEYNLLLSRRSLDPSIYKMSSRQKWSLIPLIVLLVGSLPIFVYSFINSIFPIVIAKMATAKIKDLQFISSVRFAIGLLLFPLFHIIQIVVFALITKDLIYTLIYAASLPIGAFIVFEWKKRAELVWARLREVKFNIFSPKRVKRLQELNVDIKNQMWKIVNFKEEEDYMSNSDAN